MNRNDLVPLRSLLVLCLIRLMSIFRLCGTIKRSTTQKFFDKNEVREGPHNPKKAMEGPWTMSNSILTENRSNLLDDWQGAKRGQSIAVAFRPSAAKRTHACHTCSHQHQRRSYGMPCNECVSVTPAADTSPKNMSYKRKVYACPATWAW